MPLSVKPTLSSSTLLGVTRVKADTFFTVLLSGTCACFSAYSYIFIIWFAASLHWQYSALRISISTVTSTWIGLMQGIEVTSVCWFKCAHVRLTFPGTCNKQLPLGTSKLPAVKEIFGTSEEYITPTFSINSPKEDHLNWDIHGRLICHPVLTDLCSLASENEILILGVLSSQRGKWLVCQRCEPINHTTSIRHLKICGVVLQLAEQPHCPSLCGLSTICCIIECLLRRWSLVMQWWCPPIKGKHSGFQLWGVHRKS